jgi:hypothetical protein
MKSFFRHPLRCVLAVSLVCAPFASALAADAEIDKVRGTTTKLINMLVEQGLLTRERAEALLKEIQSTTPSAGSASATNPAGPSGGVGPAQGPMADRNPALGVCVFVGSRACALHPRVHPQRLERRTAQRNERAGGA